MSVCPLIYVSVGRITVNTGFAASSVKYFKGAMLEKAASSSTGGQVIGPFRTGPFRTGPFRTGPFRTGPF